MERPWGRMTSAFELMRGTDSRLPAAQVDAAFRGKLSIAFRSPDGAKRNPGLAIAGGLRRLLRRIDLSPPRAPYQRPPQSVACRDQRHSRCAVPQGTEPKTLCTA